MKIRSAVVILASAFALTAGAAAPVTAGGGHAPDNLRELAKKTHVRIGSAVDVDALANDADYRRLLNRQFNNITAENAMKWAEVEPERGQFDWSGADAIVANARRNHQQIRGHTLLWHNQLPEWLTANEANWTQAELRGILRDHIFKEAGRYRGKIRAWDVVNEVVADGGGLRDTIWLRKLGPGYIADAFRWAHQADPRAKLYINDYNLESDQAKVQTTYEIVTDLLKKRVPIDGVGFQGHLGIQFDYPTTFPANMKRFTDLGLEVAVTEADVRMVLPVTPEKQAAQATYFQNLLRTCLENRRCTEFTTWGYTDRYQWVPGFFEGEGSAALYDEDLVPKPAYFALLELGKRKKR
jgi:endo-1,4-beta-xylanase